MLGFTPVAAAPLAGSNAGSKIVSAALANLTITTYDATISTGAVVIVDNSQISAFNGGFSSGFGTTLWLSGFDEGFSRGFGPSFRMPTVGFKTFPAQIVTSAGVQADTAELTITTYPALVTSAGVIKADTAELTITTYPAEIKTAGYVTAITRAVTITTYPATISTPGLVRADRALLDFIEYGADISTSGLVEAQAGLMQFITFPVRIKMGRNPKLYKEQQKFSPTNMITLYELDATAIGGTYMRFTSTAHEADAVRFGGNVYVPVPVEAEGFEISGQGTLPTPRLRVLNTPTLQSGVISLNDLLGATFYRIRTFRTFLDDGDDPDANAKFPVDIYKVERKVSQNKVYIEWELSAAIDQEGKMIPGRQIIRDFCTHIYRVWNPETESFDYTKATCPYAGALKFDESDNPTNSSGDRCGKRLSSCRARFGSNAQLPTRAFPGVAKVR